MFARVGFIVIASFSVSVLLYLVVHEVSGHHGNQEGKLDCS
jgi:hypothetical protein